MAEYWVGPSLRQRRPDHWIVSDAPYVQGPSSGLDRRRSRPLTPRRWRALIRLTALKLKDVTFLARYVAHAVVLVLTLTVGLLHGRDFSAILYSAPANTATESSESMFWTASQEESTASLSWSVLPQTIIRERPAAARYEPLTYEVREGDNPTTIAALFGLQPSTIIWSNQSENVSNENPDLLSIGQTLTIPPVDGVLHTVESGDTIAELAEMYEVDVEKIASFPGNDLEGVSATLSPGQKVMVPGGIVPYEPPKPVASSSSDSQSSTASSSSSSSNTASRDRQQSSSNTNQAATSSSRSNYRGSGTCCIWPVRGRITQNPRRGHVAIDVAAPIGTPVVAGAGGRVVTAGWSRYGYGLHVVVDHGNGTRTLYAHFSQILVRYGQWVNQGQLVGRIGSTGNSTGPHLHFEVRRGGVLQNPYNWLR